MKRKIALISFVLMAASLSAAQTQPAKAPAAPTAPATTPTPPALTVAQILKKYHAAMGSTLTSSKITSTVATGTFEMPTMGATGTVEIYAKAPGKQFTKITINGLGTFLDGYDGVDAWTQNPMAGLRSKAGVELAQARIASTFDRDAILEKLYPKMEAKGTEKVEGHDAYVVLATTPDAGTETWYFDAQSFFMIRQDAVAEGPDGKLPVQTYFDDFRLVGGAKVPFLVRATNPSFTVIMRLTDVKPNAVIDDAKFAKPTAP